MTLERPPERRLPAARSTPRVSLTPRQLNRATLDRQMLLRRESMTAVDAVRRVVALQAQEPASPYLALWNRVADFDPAALATAFDERDVVKATLMRLTLHAPTGGPWSFTASSSYRAAPATLPAERWSESVQFLILRYLAAFGPASMLTSAEWDGLAAEAAALQAFLSDRDSAVYRRYEHWWTKDLPHAEVRILPG